MNQTAWACSLGAICLWAIFATLVRHVGPVPPLYLTGIALCLGSLATLHRWREWRVPLPTFAFGTVCLFVYHVCLIAAFGLAPIAEANLINYLWPLFLVLLAPWIARSGKLRRLQMLGCAVAFAGCALAIGPAAFSSSHLLGYGLALVAALTWAAYSLGLGRFPPYSSWATGGFCLAAGLLSLLAHALFEPAATPAAGAWVWIAAIGIGTLGVSFLLWDMAIRRGNPSLIGSLSYLTPPLSTLGLALDGAVSADAFPRLGGALLLVLVGVRLSK
jgi:drug/metabolite transporter (DMT)-like permease